MNIFRNTVVTLSFKLYDSSNKLIEQTDEPVAYLHGGHSGIFPKVEEALKDKKVGDGVTDLLVLERLLDLGKDSRVAAMQVGHRFVGLLDQLVARIVELERERYDRIAKDVHRVAFGIGRRVSPSV